MRNYMLVIFLSDRTIAENLGRWGRSTGETEAEFQDRLKQTVFARLRYATAPVNVCDWSYYGSGWIDGPNGSRAFLSVGLQDVSI